MQKCGFIRDGYTRDGYIAEGDYYPALTFKYRPMLAVDRFGILRRIAESDQAKSSDGKTDKGAQEGEKILIAETARRLVSWDLADDQGQIVSISEQNVAKVEPHLLSELFEVISGTKLGDVRPSDGEEGEAAKN